LKIFHTFTELSNINTEQHLQKFNNLSESKMNRLFKQIFGNLSL
jgi:hypothetical protein